MGIKVDTNSKRSSAPDPRPVKTETPKPAKQEEPRPVVKQNRAEEPAATLNLSTNAKKDDSKAIVKETSTPKPSTQAVKEMIKDETDSYTASKGTIERPVTYSKPQGPVKVTDPAPINQQTIKETINSVINPQKDERLVSGANTESTKPKETKAGFGETVAKAGTPITIAKTGSTIGIGLAEDYADNKIKNASKNAISVEKEMLALDPACGKAAHEAKKELRLLEQEIGYGVQNGVKVAKSVVKALPVISDGVTVVTIKENFEEFNNTKSDYKQNLALVDLTTNSASLIIPKVVKVPPPFNKLVEYGIDLGSLGIGILTENARAAYDKADENTKKLLDQNSTPTTDNPAAKVRRDGITNGLN